MAPGKSERQTGVEKLQNLSGQASNQPPHYKPYGAFAVSPLQKGHAHQKLSPEDDPVKSG
jgi:hypothetical protein